MNEKKAIFVFAMMAIALLGGGMIFSQVVRSMRYWLKGMGAEHMLGGILIPFCLLVVLFLVLEVLALEAGIIPVIPMNFD